MELGESTREGAARETVEEAGAKIETGALLAVYNLPGQVQMLYLAELVDGAISAGAESLEVKLFAWDELPPSEELAFPTVEWALEYAAEVLKGGADAGGAVVPQQRTKLIFDNSSGFAEETELQQM